MPNGKQLFRQDSSSKSEQILSSHFAKKPLPAMLLDQTCPGLLGTFQKNFNAVTYPLRISGVKHMAKNTRKVNKANHGRRPASSKARKARRRKLGV